MATFNNLSLTAAGTYTLAVGDGGLTGVFSSPVVATVGYVDTANMNAISGWAFDPSDPAASINVEVDISGGPAQTFSADQTRLDLQPILSSTDHGFTYSTPVLSVGNHTAYIYAVETNNTKVLLATKTLVSQNSLFDEHYYLAMNPDVAVAVALGEFATGYDHYIKYGQFEGRSPSPYWDESYYLRDNPDVAAAVKAGKVSSGFMHYYLYGQYENRPGLFYFNTSYYLQNNPDVAAAVTAGTISSAFEHFVLYGQYEGRAARCCISHPRFMMPTTPAFSHPSRANPVHPITSNSWKWANTRVSSPRTTTTRQTYLADNPDVAAAVLAGGIPDGFQHWLEYGQYEGRTAV